MILLRPVPPNHRITQLFGENPALYPSTKGHNGIDYGLPEGVPVSAAAAGQVIRAELDTETARNPKAGYGLARPHPAPQRLADHLRSPLRFEGLHRPVCSYG